MAMSWQPKYRITHQLLTTIREIGQTTGLLQAYILKNNLAKLESSARELSTYASTSIEGNPLPLTDVKQLLKNHKKNIRDTEREIINYNKALETVYQKVAKKEFTFELKTLENIQKIVTDG